jgi:hypothetical protein
VSVIDWIAFGLLCCLFYQPRRKRVTPLIWHQPSPQDDGTAVAPTPLASPGATATSSMGSAVNASIYSGSPQRRDET